MREIWNRIEQWLRANAPQVAETLQPGATEQQIVELESLLGRTLPADLRESLLIHDGQTEYPDVGFVDTQEFLSLERIRKEWSVWKELFESGAFTESESEPDVGVRPDWWNPLWVPLTYDGAGNHYCIDLAPADGGSVGQLITMWHDNGARTVLAPNFRAWLGAYADALENGRVVFSEEDGGLMNATNKLPN